MEGSLTCVGVGISIGAHITPIVKNTIEKADIVFAAASDGLFELWLSEIHPNVISLQKYYGHGKSRKTSYQEMTQALLEPVRQGKKVVAAFYGHPGVFVNPSHKAIKIAKSEGYEAKMLPGISAEDCLYADLGIDPGKYGCQHYETSQFMFYKRIIDPSAYLVLWQPFFAGDYSHSSRSSVPEYLTVLVEILAETYPLDHEIIVYQAASNALRQAEIEKGPLKSLVQFQLTMQSTLVIPPSKPLLKNTRVMQILESKRKKEIVRLITG